MINNNHRQCYIIACFKSLRITMMPLFYCIVILLYGVNFQQVGNISLTISVLDMNDNAPTFTETEFFFHIPEQTGKNTLLGNLTVCHLLLEHSFQRSCNLNLLIMMLIKYRVMFQLINLHIVDIFL